MAVGVQAGQFKAWSKTEQGIVNSLNQQGVEKSTAHRLPSRSRSSTRFATRTFCQEETTFALWVDALARATEYRRIRKGRWSSWRLVECAPHTDEPDRI